MTMLTSTIGKLTSTSDPAASTCHWLALTEDRLTSSGVRLASASEKLRTTSDAAASTIKKLRRTRAYLIPYKAANSLSDDKMGIGATMFI
jgi:hypothetical protein